MLLRGLPDLEKPITEEGVTLLYPFEGDGPFAVLPDELRLGERRDGSCDFSLELITGSNPALPPDPYAVLDFRVTPRLDLERALTIARRTRPRATVTPISFASGFLRLRLAVGAPAPATDLPPGIFEPVSLASNGLGQSRYVLRLSHDAGFALRAALAGEHLGLEAWAEMEFPAVSPRVPVDVTVDPAALVRALAEHAEPDGRTITWTGLIAAFLHPEALPLSMKGSVPSEHRQAFAEAMADRVRERFATFVASPVPNEPAVRLLAPEQVGTGSVRFSLSVPTRALRPVGFRLDPFRTAREQVVAKGIDSIVRRTRVPSFDFGVRQVDVIALLPAGRRDVLSLRAELSVPPWPPRRPQAIAKAVDLKEPKDAGTVAFQLASGEALTYTVTTSVVLRGKGGIRKLTGTRFAESATTLELYAEHFPVDFAPIEAGAQLLEVANVHGICRRTGGSEPVEIPFELTAENPSLTLVVPRAPEPFVVEIEARERDGEGILRTTLASSFGYTVDVYDFAEYGGQTVDIEVEPGHGLQAIDLLPEGAPETPAAMTVLTFDGDQARHSWNFLPLSIFRARYRYRPHAGGASAGPWSELRSALEPLRITT